MIWEDSLVQDKQTVGGYKDSDEHEQGENIAQNLMQAEEDIQRELKTEKHLFAL